jgi:NitT/TauT family transport system substrate-binding protein
LAGVKIYDEADNKAFFGTPDKPGPIYQTVKYAIDIWSSKGKMQVQAKPEDLIDYSFVNK